MDEKKESIAPLHAVTGYSYASGGVSNARIYGLPTAVKWSKLPMATDPIVINNDVTGRQDKLAGAPAGSGHDNFLKGIIVQFEWKVSKQLMPELERYHWIDIVSSQSTMHRLSQIGENDRAYNQYVDSRVKTILQELIREYNAYKDSESYLRMIYNCPSGLMLTMGISTNYLQLKTVYRQRRDHRLPEWRNFCRWVETLPYAEWITGKKEEQND